MNENRAQNLDLVDAARIAIDSIVPASDSIYDAMYTARSKSIRFLEEIDRDDVRQQLALHDLRDDAQQVLATLRYQTARLEALVRELEEKSDEIAKHVLAAAAR